MPPGPRDGKTGSTSRLEGATQPRTCAGPAPHNTDARGALPRLAGGRRARGQRTVTRADGTFAGQGGVAIRWWRVAPDAPPRGVVVVCHGYGEHSARHLVFARHLASRGIAAVGFDHRGHGESGGPRGHCRDVAEYVGDVRTVVDLAAAWWPEVPRVLFGHSMGGLIAFLYLLDHAETVRAGVLTGPAFRIPDGQPMALLRLLVVIGRFLPRLAGNSHLDPAKLSRDPAVVAAYRQDPLVHSRASAGFIRAFDHAQRRALADAATCRVPLLVLQGDADGLVHPDGTRAVVANLTCPHELVMLPGYYHEPLNEPAEARAAVLARLDAWLDRHLAA